MLTCVLLGASCSSGDQRGAATDIYSVSGGYGPDFNLTVIILTMNRPNSLQRLLESLKATDFEFASNKFDIEFHIDKTVGGLYDETVRIAESFEMPADHRGSVRV